MAISGHIFTKLAWMKHLMILMSLIGLKYESEHHVLNAGGGKGFWSRYKFVGAGALSWPYLGYGWFYLQLECMIQLVILMQCIL